jgi:hypothetical protein
MIKQRIDVIQILRSMAQNRSMPSEMLQELIAAHPSEPLTRNVFYEYFTEAFCFSEGEASPLYGWLPDGTGELTDGDIDELMTKRIQANRSAWENGGR